MEEKQAHPTKDLFQEMSDCPPSLASSETKDGQIKQGNKSKKTLCVIITLVVALVIVGAIAVASLGMAVFVFFKLDTLQKQLQENLNVQQNINACVSAQENTLANLSNRMDRIEDTIRELNLTQVTEQVQIVNNTITSLLEVSRSLNLTQLSTHIGMLEEDITLVNDSVGVRLDSLARETHTNISELSVTVYTSLSQLEARHNLTTIRLNTAEDVTIQLQQDLATLKANFSTAFATNIQLMVDLQADIDTINGSIEQLKRAGATTTINLDTAMDIISQLQGRLEAVNERIDQNVATLEQLGEADTSLSVRLDSLNNNENLVEGLKIGEIVLGVAFSVCVIVLVIIIICVCCCKK